MSTKAQRTETLLLNAPRLKRNVEAACKALEAEADEWRKDHGESEEADYASGLLSAVHDIRLALLGKKP